MRRNRLPACLFALLCAFLPVSGCDKSDESIDLFGDSGTYKNLGEATLTICVPGWYGGEENPDTRLVLDEIERRTRESLRLKINLVTLEYIEYESELKRRLTSGEPCDMYLSYFDEQTNIVRTMSEAGLALDLTSLFPRYAQRYARLLPPEELRPLVVDGKLLAVKNNQPYTDRISVVVRDELLQKYNHGPIRGLDDLEAFLDTLKKGEEGMTVLTLTQPLLSLFAPSAGYVIVDYDTALVYKWNDPALRVMAWEQTPEYRQALERAARWAKKGFLNDMPIYTPDPNLIRSKLWGVWLVNEGSSARFNEVLYTEKDGGRFVEFPLFPDAPCQRLVWPPTGWMISPRSKNPERALMFLEWIHSSQKNYDLIRYGIEGKHFLLKGEQWDFPEGVTHEDSYFDRSGFWDAFIDINFERTHVSSPPGFQRERVDTLCRRAVFPPHAGTALDLSGIDSVMRKRTAYEMEWKLLTGGVTEDALRNYIKEQKWLGIDKLVTRVQAQLDAFRKQRDAAH